MPADQIDDLMDIWAATLPAGSDPPFADHDDIYDTIDKIAIGEVPWKCFSASYSGERPVDAPTWMLVEYDVWFRDPRSLARNQLANPEFEGEVDYAPKQVFNEDHGRVWSNFMSGNWAWEQAVSRSFHPWDVAECPSYIE